MCLCCSREHRAQGPIWMAPFVNASLKCVIPEQPGSCVWWREPGSIGGSTGDWMSPERARKTERSREEERHHTDSMNDTSYDCLGQSCSLWLPVLHSPTVLHFKSPGPLIYYTQQTRCCCCPQFQTSLRIIFVCYSVFTQHWEIIKNNDLRTDIISYNFLFLPQINP